MDYLCAAQLLSTKRDLVKKLHMKLKFYFLHFIWFTITHFFRFTLVDYETVKSQMPLHQHTYANPHTQFFSLQFLSSSVFLLNVIPDLINHLPAFPPWNIFTDLFSPAVSLGVSSSVQLNDKWNIIKLVVGYTKATSLIL